METYPVELLDEYIRLQRVSNDHQIRAIICFDSHVDVAMLERALSTVIEQIPLICCKFKIKGDKRYWEHREYESKDCIRIKSLENEEQSVVGFLDEVPNDEGPQVLLQVLRFEQFDKIIVTVNHMIFDGTGFKEFLYLLGSSYSGISVLSNPLDRRLSSVLKDIGFFSRLKAIMEKPKKVIIPRLLSVGDETSATRLNTLRITKGELCTIRKFCKENGSTVNDLIMAALAKVLADLQPELNHFTLRFMVDLRRYVRTNLQSPFSNYASMESITFKIDQLTLLDILQSVTAETRKIKNGTPGLRNILLLKLIHSLTSWKAFEKILSNEIRRIGFSTTNLGVVDSDRLVFGGLNIEDFYLLTSVKKEPAFQVTIITFRESLTLSILGELSIKNQERIALLLNKMKTELLQVCNICKLHKESDA